MEYHGPGSGSGAEAGWAVTGGGDCASPGWQPSRRTLRSHVPARGAAGLGLCKRQGFGAPSAHRPPKEALLPWDQALGSWPGPGARRAHGQRRELQRRLGGRGGAAVGRGAALRRAPLLALPPGGAGASDRRVPGPGRCRGERQRDDGAADRALPGHADHHQLVPGQHGRV